MAQLDSLVVIRFQVCIFDILNTAGFNVCLEFFAL